MLLFVRSGQTSGQTIMDRERALTSLPSSIAEILVQYENANKEQASMIDKYTIPPGWHGLPRHLEINMEQTDVDILKTYYAVEKAKYFTCLSLLYETLGRLLHKSQFTPEVQRKAENVESQLDSVQREANVQLTELMAKSEDVPTWEDLVSRAAERQTPE